MNVALFTLSHFLFADAKQKRLQAPNYHMVVLFANRRGLHQIATFARQCTGDSKFLCKVFDHVTSTNPYGYLVIDLRNSTIPEAKLITNVFCENGEPNYVFV